MSLVELVGVLEAAAVAGNQRAIPVIQTSDLNVTQLQQNANKVLRNLSNNIDTTQASVNELTIIGEIKIADLSVIQFQSIAGTNWILCNGQSCVGTKYSTLTGNNTVPTLTLGSVNNFIRVN
jgi:uncharacterized protein YlxW (UPF0749 family)